MSEAKKYTPGPWVAIPTRTRLQCCNSRPLFDNGLWAILPESNLYRIPIGVVDHANDHDPPTRQKAEFDAKLMAAAPDLLEALKDLTGWEYRHDLSCQHPHVNPCMCQNHIMERAISAIAKAEARS